MRKIGIALGLLCGLLVLVIATATGTAEARPVRQTDSDENCITCHTSRETLEELAVEPEDEEELSEGEG